MQELGLAVGYWDGLEDVKKNWKKDREFIPAIDDDERKTRVAGWHKAVERSENWV